MSVGDETGRPVAGAAVHLSLADLRSTESGPGPDYDTDDVLTGSDGTVQIAIPAWRSPRYAVARRAGWPAQAVDATDVPAKIVLGPARSIPAHLGLGGCPGGHISVVIEPVLHGWERQRRWRRPRSGYDALEPARATVALDGAFRIDGLGPGTYRVQIEACGTVATANVSGRDTQLDLTLPVRRADRPTEIPISLTRRAPLAARACRFTPATTGRLFAGDVYRLFLDPRCRLFIETSDEQWSMMLASGAVVPLGKTDDAALQRAGDVAGAGHGVLTVGAAVAVVDASTPSGTTTRVVSLATGGVVEDFGGLVDRATAPDRDDLAHSKLPPVGDRAPQALELRLADSTRIHVADHVTQYAWTDDGRLLYVVAMPGAATGVLHVFDPRDSSDRRLGDATIPWEARPILWPLHGQVLVDNDGTLDRIDLATLHRARLVDAFEGGTAMDGFAFYKSRGRLWLHDLDTGAATEVGAVTGYLDTSGRAGSRLVAAPKGELLLAGEDVAVAADRRLRLLCEQASLVDVSDGFALCSEFGTERMIAVPLDGRNRGVALGVASERWRLAPDDPIAFGIRTDGALVEHSLDDQHEVEIVSSVSAFLPLGDGRILYAVPNDGLYFVRIR